METFLLQPENILDILNHSYEGVFIVDKNKTVIYWNPAAEKISGYLAAEVLGQRCCEKAPVPAGDNGLCDHALCLPVGSDRKVYKAEGCITHKAGHQVPVSSRVIPLYQQNDCIGFVKLFRDNSPRETLMKELASLHDRATIDSLTGLRNRRYAEMALNAKLGEIRADGIPFGVLFIDIDHFKTINDTYGHDTGDMVLQMLARTLLMNTRQHDAVVRWGGEEIIAIIVSPNIQRKLYLIANKLRQLIQQSMLPLDDGRTISVTVSIGATVALPADTADSLIKRADQLMYLAKKSGRNCVKMDG